MDRQATQSLPSAFIAGALIGVLGGMIGLGGAEFRLPLLIGVFGFVALQVVIMNKAMSLIVVLTALSARLFSVPGSDVAPHLVRGGDLLPGSLVGAWVGAALATQIRSATQYRVLAVLLVAVAGVLIGVLAALMDAAGGELLIPTIVLLYGVDFKIAGSLSLAVSLPTMLVAFSATTETRASGSCGRTTGSCWRYRPGRTPAP